METITSITDIAVGDSVFIMQRGEYVGPFTVLAIGERTADHAILRARTCDFAHYVPWNTYREGMVALCDELNMSAEYCEGCGHYVDSVAQYVPGDRNAAYVCRACGIAWQETHVWDDAMGTFVEITSGREI